MNARFPSPKAKQTKFCITYQVKRSSRKKIGINEDTNSSTAWNFTKKADTEANTGGFL